MRSERSKNSLSHSDCGALFPPSQGVSATFISKKDNALKSETALTEKKKQFCQTNFAFGAVHIGG